MGKETELETLFYSIEARTQHLKPQIAQAQRIIDDVAKHAVEIPVTLDVAPVESGSKRVKRALGEIDAASKRSQAQVEAHTKSTQAAAASQDQATKSTEGFAQAFRGLAAAAVVVQSIAYAKEAIALADAYTNIKSRLTLVTDGTENFAKVQQGLFEVSQATRTDLGSTVALYTSLARSTKSLGISQTDLIGITKTVGQTFLISGASASETAAAVRQLGQALASGVLRGDEFNSISENAPRLQQAVADSLGITIGQLRQYAADGKLTAAVVTKALQESASAIENESRSIALTVDGAMVQVKNALLLAIGEFNNASGATAGLAKALSELTQSTDEVGKKTVSSATKFGLLASAASSVAEALRNVLGLNNEIGESTPKMIERLRAGFSDAGDAVRRYLDARKGIVEAGAPELPKLTLTSTKGFTVADTAGYKAPVSPEYKKAADAAALLRDRQKELNTALGFGADTIEETNARFDLKAKLMDIDADAAKADSKITKEQAEQLKGLARETYEYEKSLRAVKAAKAAQQIVDEAKKKNDEIAKRDQKEVKELLDGVTAAHAKGADAVKKDAEAQAFELSIIGKVGAELNKLTDARLYATKLAEYEGTGMDKLAARRAAEAFVTREQTKRQLELVDAAHKYEKELAGKSPFDIPGDGDAFLKNMQEVLGLVDSISDVLGDAGGEFAKTLKQAASSIRGVVQGAQNLSKLKSNSSLGESVGAALPIVGAAVSAISFWASSTKATAEAAHQAATALRELRQSTQASIAAYKLEANGSDLDQTLAGLKSQFDAIYASLIKAGGVDPNAPPRTAHSIVPSAEDFATAEAAYKKLVQAAIDAAAKAAAQVEADAKAAAVQKAQSNAARILDDDIKSFGLTGSEALSTVIASLTTQFADIGTAVSGLDLSTQTGLDALRARGQQLLTQFKSDGTVTDDEQKILDALFRIFDMASDIFDSLAERVQRAQAKLDDDNEILGGNQRTQFGRGVDAAKGFNPILDQILGSVDLTKSDGAASFRHQLQSLYENLLVDGLTEEETAIVGLIKSLLHGLDNAVDEAQQQAEADAASALATRAKSRERGTRTNAVTDAEGVPAFVNFLSTLAPAISNLFGEFDVRALTGIDAAKERLAQLNGTIESMSDKQIMAQFGLTRDELIDGILALDGSLDGLKQTALSAADAAKALANAQQDFTASVTDDYLRASGNDREADINAVKAKTNAKLDKAKEFGSSQDVIDTILKTGEKDLANINQRYDSQAAAAVERAGSASSTGISGSASNDFSSTGIASITSVQALRLIDIESSQLAVQQQLLSLWSRYIGGLPTLTTPALPNGVGGFNVENNGPVVNNINITVPGGLLGSAMGESAKELARELLPLIDQGLGRRVVDAGRRTGNQR